MKVCNIVKTKAQYGRSMVEMLGVLAIIGVLSIGGIAGYSMAMEKYKINKTIEDIKYITMEMLELIESGKSIEGLGCYTNNEDVFSYCDTNSYMAGIIDKFGVSSYYPLMVRDYDLASDNDKYHFGQDFKTFTIQIRLQEVPENACIALKTADWEKFNITELKRETATHSLADARASCNSNSNMLFLYLIPDGAYGYDW